MKKYFFYLFLATILLFNCEKSQNELTDFSSLNGNNFVMKVDRIVLYPNVQFPMNALEESNYQNFDGEKNYNISFSEDGQIITLGTGSISGYRTNTEDDTIVFELTEGLFAGGRFIVRINGDKLEAELTIYGSGVPIISSERGILLPV